MAEQDKHQCIDSNQADTLASRVIAEKIQGSCGLVVLCSNCRTIIDQALSGKAQHVHLSEHELAGLRVDIDVLNEEYENGKKIVNEEIEAGTLALDEAQLLQRKFISRSQDLFCSRSIDHIGGQIADSYAKDDDDQFGLQLMRYLGDPNTGRLLEKGKKTSAVFIFLSALFRDKIHTVLGDEEFLENFRRRAGIED